MAETNKQQVKDKINRIVNGNIMCSLLYVLKEDLEYFRGEYKGGEKNVFKRIVTNCDILFNKNSMSEEEIKEIETVSNAMIDSIYEIRMQYRKHVEKQFINE
tara:strand:+ start:374 stop:679 length:306 start_codon:yes stop_codon:yes gene_type:complete